MTARWEHLLSSTPAVGRCGKPLTPQANTMQIVSWFSVLSTTLSLKILNKTKTLHGSDRTVMGVAGRSLGLTQIGRILSYSVGMNNKAIQCSPPTNQEEQMRVNPLLHSFSVSIWNKKSQATVFSVTSKSPGIQGQERCERL